ncbi:hypothetical protein BDV97DRAFT_349644 [Delphinella strobiligena]|nr:hypothetical protein BDV97DRAFT_349644 [Delphinella strobiligena]
MEYFGGLLFLTPNRVGFIDEAFISRVHVIIGFEKLGPFRRRDIWQTFLDKLERERAGKMRVGNSAKNFCLGDEMNAMDWNGREIRNALQTAIALAEYDERERPGEQEGREVVVESENFKKVMSMSKSFHAYLDSVRRDTESDRAKQFYGRNDYFRQQAQGIAQAQNVQYGGPVPRMASQFGPPGQGAFELQHDHGVGMNVAQDYASSGGTTQGGFGASQQGYGITPPGT